MSKCDSHDDNRMLQLLADRATEGLGEMDAAALGEWLAMNPDIDPDAFERAAAVVALIGTSQREESLPSSLRGKLLFDAGVTFGWSN